MSGKWLGKAIIDVPLYQIAGCVLKEMAMDEEHEIAGPPVRIYPVNRAQAWFRMALWLVPTVFFAGSWIGMVKLTAYLRPDSPWVLTWVWLLLNVAFAIGTAWFQVMLSERSQAEGIEKAYHVLIYSLVQIFLVPALLLFLIVTVGLLSGWITA